MSAGVSPLASGAGVVSGGPAPVSGVGPSSVSTAAGIPGVMLRLAAIVRVKKGVDRNYAGCFADNVRCSLVPNNCFFIV